MNGHSTPRRASAWLVLLIIVAMCMLACACGSGDEQTPAGSDAALPAGGSDAGTPAEATFPVTLTDDNGNSATINAAPTRIVSTAPANTEILFALGVGDRVVGVTSLCDYPPEVADLPKVGDYMVNAEAVMALSPDLVVGYSGNEEGLTPVQESGAAVLIFNPSTIEGIYANIATVGAATGATSEAANLIADIRAAIQQTADAAATAGDSPGVFYILDTTLWTTGTGTFVDELLALANAKNAAASDPEGATVEDYYQCDPERLVAADPDMILLSGLGFPSLEDFTTDPRFAGLTAIAEGRVFVVDPEYDKLLTLPGARIADGLKALVDIIHPGVL